MNIKKLIKTVNLEIENKTNLYNQDIAKLCKLKREIQNECKHEDTTYYPDASGNNDYCYICNDCELEKKRFK